MTIPDFQTLMLPVLKCASQGEVRISEVVEGLSEDFKLSVEDRSHLLPSGRQTTFSNRVHWAKSYLSKAGLVELTRRAHFKITERGKSVLASPPAKIDIKFLSQFPEFLKFREAQESDDSSKEAVSVGSEILLAPDEVMRDAHRKLEVALAEDLLQRMRASTPAYFESLVVRFLVAMKYGGSITSVEQAVVGGSGDNGIDGVIDQDVLGLDRIYVQAKRYADGNNVGAGAIRDFFGSLDRHKAHKGVFVTTSTFSAGAKETANALSKRIVLIDGAQMARLMVKHGVGCRVEETLELKKIDEEFFE
jgi:restriction system protein